MARAARACKARHRRFSLALMLLFLLGLGSLFCYEQSAGALSSAMDLRSDEQPLVEALMARVGIDPVTLATIGCDGDEVPAMVAAAEAWFAASGPGLARLDQQLAEAHANCVRIERSRRRGETTYSAQAHTEALIAVSLLETAVTTRLADARESLVGGLDASQTSLLSRMKANDRWSLPGQYRAVSLSEEDWLAVVNAIRCGADAPQADLAVLNDVHAAMDFTLAAANRAAKEQAIALAWDQAWVGH